MNLKGKKLQLFSVQKVPAESGAQTQKHKQNKNSLIIKCLSSGLIESNQFIIAVLYVGYGF